MLNNKYALNNEISVYFFVHVWPSSVYCKLGLYIQAEDMISFTSAVRGHHVCKAVWTPLLGEPLSVRPEIDNNYNKYTVSVMKNGRIIGHSAVPRQLMWNMWHNHSHVGRMRLTSGGLDV